MAVSISFTRLMFVSKVNVKYTYISLCQLLLHFRWRMFIFCTMSAYGMLITEAAFYDLHLSISNDIVSTKIYDKRDDFDFEIVISHF